MHDLSPREASRLTVFPDAATFTDPERVVVVGTLYTPENTPHDNIKSVPKTQNADLNFDEVAITDADEPFVMGRAPVHIPESGLGRFESTDSALHHSQSGSPTPSPINLCICVPSNSGDPGTDRAPQEDEPPLYPSQDVLASTNKV